jgi:hypothetical protein
MLIIFSCISFKEDCKPSPGMRVYVLTFKVYDYSNLVKTKEGKIGFSKLNSIRIVNSILKVFWKTGSDDIDYGSINLFGYIDDVDYGNIFWSSLKSIHLGPGHLMMTKQILKIGKIYFSSMN